MSEFFEKMARGDQNGALYERGYFVSPPTFGETALSPTPPMPVERAFLQRSRACRLIDRGLANHPGRLDAHQWRHVQTFLQILDPTASWLPLHVAEVIGTTRRVADEQAGSHGVWNLMEAASFQTWAKELIEVLEQYRQTCEALHVRLCLSKSRSEHP